MKRAMKYWPMAALVVLAGCDCASEPWPGPDRPQSLAAEAISEPGSLTEEEWRSRLTEEQYAVLREHGTEWAFSGELLHEDRDGVFHCAGCGAPLFASGDKFDSGTGWSSFTQPLEEDNVAEHADNSMLVPRTEIRCDRCDGHLGHVFRDGPEPTGLRYCASSVSLEFVASSDQN